jgi:non-ribosomal peptide synthetase component F
VASYVVDSQGELRPPRLQPIGVFGELWLGGVQVARGYLNRPETTREMFLAHPWSEDPRLNGDATLCAVGDRVYRTGDRVRWSAAGELDFGGRIDFQVKLRGQRIELGEIAHVLSSQPGVVEAIVLLRDDLAEAALVAYVPSIACWGVAG